MTDRIDALVDRLAPVRDEALADEVGSPGALALLTGILETQFDSRKAARTRPRKSRVIALAAAAGLAVVASGVALGVAHHVASFFAGWHDPDPPVPTASDVVIASGKAGVRWQIVATTSDRGLCLALVIPSQDSGSGGCGPTDVRGDPVAADAEHWIGAFGAGGGSAGFTERFAYGPLAKDVAGVDVLLTDGETLHAQVIKHPEGLDAPFNFYWAAWACPLQAPADGLQGCAEDGGAEVSMAVARDAEGRVLERRVPIWNGNPAGDPNGPAPPS